MDIIERLEAAYEAATPGEVRVDGHCVVSTDQDWRVVADCSDDLKTDGRAESDAKFIALLHNNAPALIECVKALKDAEAAMCELADRAGDVEEWNEYGFAYESAHRIRAALAKLESTK